MSDKETLSTFYVDLHVHTVLSPCGDLEMGAIEIVEQCRKSGIDLIAITDHNTEENWQAIAAVAGGNPVVLPGVEVQTAEDVHLLCVFDCGSTAKQFKDWLWTRMPRTRNNSEIFGEQVVINASNEIIRFEEILLVQGVGYDVDEVISHVKSIGGLSILAHADRTSFSYPANLGPIPQDYPVDGIELSKRITGSALEEWRRKYPKHSFIRSSDSHMLQTLDKKNTTAMMLASPTFLEVQKALKNQDGRRILHHKDKDEV